MEDNTTTQKMPVVAIGASEGGYEAMVELLKHLPADTGMTYVYVQYGGAVPDTDLPALLQQHTAMPVAETATLEPLQPDHLYVVATGREIGLQHRRVVLEPTSPTQSRMAINQLFMLLAEHYQEMTIGVILSGAANDGALGLKAIKLAGGLSFAQDETADFRGMPKSAVAEGAVDLVLAPKEIAEELGRIASQKEQYYNAIADVDQLASSSDEELHTILLYINKSMGIDFTQYKMNTIRRRVARRMMLHKFESMKDYGQFLKQNTKEVNLLYQDLLINVTTFFRDKGVSEYERQTLLPAIVSAKAPNESIRIWVPACSTGQEVYSLAILLFDTLGKKAGSTPIQIFATDLSEPAINKARLGVYSKSDLDDMPAHFLETYFTRTDGHYRIIKSIRDVCIFATHNIAKDPPFSRLDLISCCNLLIYLDNALQKKVLNTFHYSLNPNGYLVLGKSEAIGSSAHLFSLVDKRLKVYSKKKDAIAKALFEINYRLPRQDGKQVATGKVVPDTRREGEIRLEKVVDQLLLKMYTPASVVVNYELDILQFRGPIGMFLEPSPGKASLNLLKMARAGLGFELRNIVHKAKKTGEPAKKEGLEIKFDGKKMPISIEALPLKGGEIDDDYYLVVFEETPLPQITEGDSANDVRVKQLETELSAVREDMRSIIESQEAANEELQSANEEIVSSNEELQSINEELETSKEEIESSNEELITINQELQERNEQLTEIQEYTEGLFSITKESLLILDKDMRIKNANKSFYQTFNAKEEDTLGRLLYELGNKQWNIPRLRMLLEEVIPENTNVENFEVEHEFENIGLKVMSLNAAKITQSVHAHHLIMVAIEDITEAAVLKRGMTQKGQ